MENKFYFDPDKSGQVVQGKINHELFSEVFVYLLKFM